MLFSEIYSIYYKVLAKLITKAINKELDYQTALDIINAEAFSESFIYILDNIQNENWYLISKNYKTPIKESPHTPLSTLEKRFLKTISLDPRFQLFTNLDIIPLDDVEPLYLEKDIYYFDRNSQGDSFDDDTYKINFKKITRALDEHKLVKIVFRNRKGILQKGLFTPRKLEYSPKDDKFRLICLGKYNLSTINISRIKSVEYVGTYKEENIKPFSRNKRTVILEITNYRNALERSMLHFSHFEKEAIKLGDTKYQLKISYDEDDETEVLIRVLSFGPMIQVAAPPDFVTLIKERLLNQKSCES